MKEKGSILSAEVCARLLQDQLPRYTGCTLRRGVRLPHGSGIRIALHCDSEDDHDLLWLAYDNTGALVGLDTLASCYGDGQLAVRACIHLDVYGRLLIEEMEERTLRDGTDTVAYGRDTLEFEIRTSEEGVLDANGELRYIYRTERVPVDLTAHWVEKHGVNERGPYAWRSVKALLPVGRRVLLTASGDLNRDGAADHVLVLTDAEDSGERDLLIAFTSADRGSFQPRAMLKAFLPDKESGGFHDPIGEEGISGISVTGDTLTIAQFGGSAWKWQNVSKYVYDAVRNGFFLVEERGRTYHAPSLETQDEELSELEQVRANAALNEEQRERYAQLKKMVADAAWKVTRFPLGEKPMQPQ
mgnify:CR=1 FL=1